MANVITLSVRPSVFVREIETQDGVALLDVQRGVCLGLNRVGAHIWRLLKAGYALDRISEELSTQFDVPPQVLSADCQQFVASLFNKQLLTTAAPHTSGVSPPWRTELVNTLKKRIPRLAKSPSSRSLVSKAFWALCAYDLFGFGRNFAAIHELVTNWPTTFSQGRPQMVDQVCRAVNYACVFYPKRVRCLQRSTVTTCLLRNCGVQATMVIGAHRFPFTAHAWTEVDGHAINERRDVQKSYFVWERV